MFHVVVKQSSPEAALQTAAWLGLGQDARYFYDPMDHVPGKPSKTITLRFKDSCANALQLWYHVDSGYTRRVTTGGIVTLSRDNSE